MHIWLGLPRVVILFGALAAASTDLRRFRIYDALTLPLILSGLIYHSIAGHASGLTGSVCGILIATLPYCVIYAMGGMGAGDLKLLAAVGAWLGPWLTLHVMIISGAATACYSVALLSWNWFEATHWKRNRSLSGDCPVETASDPKATDIREVLNRSNRRNHAVPFGAMVALGTIITVLWVE